MKLIRKSKREWALGITSREVPVAASQTWMASPRPVARSLPLGENATPWRRSPLSLPGGWRLGFQRRLRVPDPSDRGETEAIRGEG